LEVGNKIYFHKILVPSKYFRKSEGDHRQTKPSECYWSNDVSEFVEAK